MSTRESDYGNRHLFTGREWDPQLVMYHYRHRTDETQDSRFLQGDPIGRLDNMRGVRHRCSAD